MGEQVHLQVCLQTPNSSPGRPQTTGTRHKNCHNNPTTPKNNPNTPQIQSTTPQLTPGHHLNIVNHILPQRTPPAKPQTPTKQNNEQRRHLCSLPERHRIEVACVNYKNPEQEQVPLSTKDTFIFQQVIIITRRKFKNQQKYVKPQHDTENRKHDAITIISTTTKIRNQSHNYLK